MRRSTLLLGALAMAACGAGRDPDLEKRAFASMEKYAAEQAARTEVATSPVATEPTSVPLKTYGQQDITRILRAVPGAGPTVRAEIRTQQGVINCTLDDRGAPQTVANFVGLATGQVAWRPTPAAPAITRPFYDQLTFHRALNDFIIQTGNPDGRRVGAGPGWRIPRETGGSGAFDAPGAIAMIDAGEDNHGSQLFITLRADAALKTQGYAAFGRCDNLNVVRTIANANKHAAASPDEAPTRPKHPVRIFSVKISRAP